MQETATMARAEYAADLTAVDLRILAHLADGKTLHDICRCMHMSHRTVCRRVSDICEAVGVGRPIQAVAWAARRGLI